MTWASPKQEPSDNLSNLNKQIMEEHGQTFVSLVLAIMELKIVRVIVTILGRSNYMGIALCFFLRLRRYRVEDGGTVTVLPQIIISINSCCPPSRCQEGRSGLRGLSYNYFYPYSSTGNRRTTSLLLNERDKGRSSLGDPPPRAPELAPARHHPAPGTPSRHPLPAPRGLRHPSSE